MIVLNKMSLVELSKIFKKGVWVVLFILLLVLGFTEAWPQFQRSIEQPAEKPILYKFNILTFSVAKQFSTGVGGIDISESKITYRRNANQDWATLENKTSKIYEYNFNLFEDIDYRRTAEEVAAFLGYQNTDQVSDAELNNQFAWLKNEVTFSINRKDKEMRQQIPNGDVFRFKQFFNSGEFLNTEVPRQKSRELLQASKRFNNKEIDEMVFEGDFFRFEGNKLVEALPVNSEIAFIRAFPSLENKKIVGKSYNYPNNFFFVGSLRPEIATNYKNFRYPTFKITKNEYKEAFNGESFDLLPVQDAVNNIIEKKYVISHLSLNGAGFGDPIPSNLKIDNISIEDFEIGFYDDYERGVAKNSLIQPIYIFKGNFDTTSGQRGRIIIYTYAVDPKYLN